MKIDAKVGGRFRKGDCRDVGCWTGELSLGAENEGDPFLIAAIYRLVTGKASEAAYDALQSDAKQCLRDYQKACATAVKKGV